LAAFAGSLLARCGGQPQPGPRDGVSRGVLWAIDAGIFGAFLQLSALAVLAFTRFNTAFTLQHPLPT